MDKKIFDEEKIKILDKADQQYKNSNPDFKIFPSNTALLVIDLQEGFVAQGARMWTPDNVTIMPKVKKLIAECRKRDIPIIYTEHVHDENGRDAGLMWDVPLNLPIKNGALRTGTAEAKTCRDIAPLPSDKVIQKHRYSAFYDTDLDTYLRGCGVDTLIISGCMTNYCCGATARDAFFRNYKVIFGSDINATDNKMLHEAELCTLRRGYARVISCTEILTEICAN